MAENEKTPLCIKSTRWPDALRNGLLHGLIRRNIFWFQLMMLITSLWLGFSIVSSIVNVYGEGTDSSAQSSKPPEFRVIAADTRKVIVDVDQTIVLTCDVKARRRDFVILWHKDDRRLFRGKRVRVKRRGQYLKITRARRDDAGYYSYEVFYNNHSCGKYPTLKKTFELVVTEELTKDTSGLAPSFTIDKSQSFIAIPVGSSIMLDCSSKGRFPLTVQWLKDGLPANERYKMIQQFQLKCGAAVPSDTGTYTCNVSNGYGWINHSYQLDVKERLRAKPVMLPLSNTTAWAGENIEIMCLALSDLMPHFQWRRWFPKAQNTSHTSAKYQVLEEDSEGFAMMPITTAIQDGAFEFTGIKLILLNVSTLQQGRYSCVAGNSLGFTIKDVYVTVRKKKGSDDCFGAADGYYPHVNNCSKFVVCKEGVTAERSCPSGLLWNKHQNFCDWPTNVSC